MVGKSLRRCSARSCFLADEMDWIDGGASIGTGVERPLRLLAGLSILEEEATSYVL
jgi:hypothetical protein